MNDFMSQEEIDALLRGGPAEPEEETTSSLVMEELKELTEMERDTIAEMANISMGSAATALSTMVNRRVSITVPAVEVSTPQLVRESYPVPCIVVDVRYVLGLKGSNLLVIRERDAAVIGDLMMGADGTNPPEEIDELYLSAVTEAMNMMMGSAATSMADLFQMHIDISPPVTFRRNLATEELELGEEDRQVVIVAFRIEIGDLIDSTMLQVLDFEFAQEMVARLMGNYEVASAEPALPVNEPVQEPVEEIPYEAPTSHPVADWNDLSRSADVAPVRSNQEYLMQLGNLNVDLIKEIPVKVRAVLGRTKMSIDNILKLGPGHIMELETLEGEPIDVYANDTLVAKGEVVVVEEQYGIRITEIANARDRISSVR